MINMKRCTPCSLKDVSLLDGFWRKIANDMCTKVIPYQWDALNDRIKETVPSYCISNFEIAAGLKEGDFGGCVFQDSDLAKWIEAASYSLIEFPNPELEKCIDETISLIANAQQEDGYLNTYFTIKEPGKRYSNLRDCHELYCAGHMMEAAVSYYEVTGKRSLLNIMLKMAFQIMSVLGPGDEKLHGYPGHEEIELALVKMYRVTGDRSLLDLATYFINERGKDPCFFKKEKGWNDKTNLEYYQAHLPVREQRTIEGHSVRALYLLSGMADIALETEDSSLFDACESLFENLRQKRMYITGGVGSTHHGEAFSFDYDLPNDTAYAETCASIALVFFCQRMLQLNPSSKYADVMERALYNTCIAGKSLDGRTFFYVNPLEVQPESCYKDPGKKHILPVRPKWFGCACCPPNLARLMTSLGEYIYSSDQNNIFVHLYIASSATFALECGNVTIQLSTSYPSNGTISFTVSKGEYSLHLRLPEWCKHCTLKLNGLEYDAPLQNGYLVISRFFNQDDLISFEMEMPIRRVYANPHVIANIGKVAFMRGPIVYCAEEVDNGKHLQNLFVPRDATPLQGDPIELLDGIPAIKIKAYKQVLDEGALYRDEPATSLTSVLLTLIPYFAWANRGENEMTVWLHEII